MTRYLRKTLPVIVSVLEMEDWGVPELESWVPGGDENALYHR